MKKLVTLMIVLLTFSLGFYNCGNGDEDACETLVCLNGGDCIDGACVCEEHYTGDECEKQVTPLFIRITKFSVNSKWNAYRPSGQRWDEGEQTPADRPDLAVELMYKGLSQIYQYHHYHKDAYYDTPFDFIPVSGLAPEILAKDLDVSYTVNLIDVDDIGYEVMGGVDFNLYDSKGGFPETLIIRDKNSALEFTLKLKYQW